MAMAASSALCNILSFISPSSISQISETSPPNQLFFPRSYRFPFNLSSGSSFSASPFHFPEKRDGHVAFGLSREDKDVFSSSASSPAFDLLSVVCPSLAYANTLFFKSAYNVQVIVDPKESEDRLVNRFRREVMKAGLIQEMRRRRYHETKQEEKKRKSREAAKRNSRKRFRRVITPKNSHKKAESKAKKEDSDDDDNWELPEGELPF